VLNGLGVCFLSLSLWLSFVTEIAA